MTCREPDRQDDAAAWVLGMLPPDEADRFVAHTADCASCAEEVARLEEVSDAIASSLDPEPTSAGLRQSLLEKIEAETALFRSAEQRDTEEPAVVRRTGRSVAVAGLAALALLGSGILVGRALDSSEPGSRTATVFGMVTPSGGGGDASAAVLAREGVSELVLKGLSPPPAGQVYQAWVVRSRGAVPTGSLFSVPRSGETKVRLPRLDDAQRVIVTAEGRQGSRTPTLPAVAVVNLAG